jgi:APA family basic amino acid/polyamine antiporter
MAVSTAKPEVFSRKASGLVRVMSPWSAFIYNFLAMGIIFPWIYVEAPVLFPGVSVWMACLIGMLIELPIAVAYVWVASAMPRSGGDYVFQSRVFGGAMAFPIVLSGIVFWQAIGLALLGWQFALLGLSPLFMGLGVHYQSVGLINAAVWVQSRTGIVIVSLVISGLMAILTISGLKNFVRVQYFMFLFTAIFIVVMIAQFLRTSPATFATAMNHFSAVANDNPNYYAWLQHDVSATGYDLFPKFAIGATLLAAPIAWMSTQWATYSVEQGGEIKGGKVFKNQFVILVGSLIVVGFIMALIAWSEQRAVGTGFFHAASASFYGGVSQSGQGIGNVLPFPATLAIVISPHPIIVILVCVGIMMCALQMACNIFIGATRIMVGMSLDRVLPTWISKVNGRTRTPVNAHVVYFFIGVIMILGWNYVGFWSKMTFGIIFAPGYVFTFSALAAALLPYRAKALYEASPGARYKVAGIPVVTIVGLIGFVFGLSVEIAFLVNPKYGLTGTLAYVFLAAVFVACVVGYWIGRGYQKGKGIDLSYAFLEVPPE